MIDKEKIKKLIKESDQSKRQVALQIGMLPQSFYNFLNDRYEGINLIKAYKLADVLGVDVNEFRKED